MGDLWSGEKNQNKTKRQVPRFRVTPLLPISVSIFHAKEKTFSALTFSPKGLGFLGLPEDSGLAHLKNIDLKIKMDKFCIDVKANVQYCSPVEKPNGRFNYFGLQFIGVKPLLNNFLEQFIAERFKKRQLILR